MNSAGNFMTRSTFTWPVTVKVTNGTKTNPMITKLPDASWGSCNSCHTAAGTSGAPGRVYAP